MKISEERKLKRKERLRDYMLNLALNKQQMPSMQR